MELVTQLAGIQSLRQLTQYKIIQVFILKKYKLSVTPVYQYEYNSS
jgi:hypothetical protein